MSISLNGLDSVRLKAGSKPYDRCPGTPRDDCDAGATATRLSPGDMSSAVVACRERAEAVLGVSKPQPMVAVGLRYCGVDMAMPATYTLTFSVSYSGGPEASAQRTVVVEANCPAGEVRVGLLLPCCCHVA